MPLTIVRNDITKMQTDAIVNAANERLLGGGGVDGMIHRAAGPRMLVECALLGGCKTGSAKVTRGYRLPCKWVIHAVGPVWRGGGHGERELLASCCRRALEIAGEKGCESVAMPLISTGAYGYPKEQALRVLTDTIGEYLRDHEMQVYIVVYDKEAVRIGEGLRRDIEQFIDDRYVDEHTDPERERLRRMDPEAENLPPEPMFAAPAPGRAEQACAPDMDFDADSADDAEYAEYGPEISYAPDMPGEADMAAVPMGGPLWYGLGGGATLDEMLDMVDESFTEMLLRKIDEKGMTDVECYKKANIDRKHFSKIRSDKLYRPKKQTALALAVALELTLEETKELLMKAGFALSRSSKVDIIVEYFITRGVYNIAQINEALFFFEQSPLGY